VVGILGQGSRGGHVEFVSLLAFFVSVISKQHSEGASSSYLYGISSEQLLAKPLGSSIDGLKHQFTLFPVNGSFFGPWANNSHLHSGILNGSSAVSSVGHGELLG